MTDSLSVSTPHYNTSGGGPWRPSQPESGKQNWGVALATVIGLLCWNTSAWLVEALVRHDRWSQRDAGLLASGELIAMIIGMGVMLRMSGLRPKTMLGIATVASVGGQLLSAVFVETTFAFVIARTLANGGCGALYMASMLLGAGSAKPAASFALAATLGLLVMAAANALLGFISQEAGPRGIILFVSALSALLSLALLRLRGALTFGSLDARFKLQAGPLAILAVVSLYSMANNGVFTFMFVIASRTGIPIDALGYGMVMASLVATVGSCGAGLLGSRPNLFVPAAISLVFLGALGLCLSLSSTPTSFWLSVAGWLAVSWFGYSYIFGIAAECDRSGGLVAAAGIAYVLTASAGSALASLVGEATFGWMQLFGCIFAGALVFTLMCYRNEEVEVFP